MKKTRIISLLLLIVMLLSACESIDLERDGIIKDHKDTVKTEDGSGEPVYGGEVVLPLTTIGSLNPLTTENIYYYYFSKLVYEGMFEYNEDLSIKNVLAESVNSNEDGTILNIKLRNDVYWHNGDKFTSADVVYTWGIMKSLTAQGSYVDMFKNATAKNNPVDIRSITDIRPNGSDGVVVSFSRPFSNNLEVLTFPIVSSNAFGASIPKGMADEDYPMIGTGPYKFSSYEKKKEVKLVANEAYRGGKPYIEKISGRILGSEQDLLVAFETGQINVATTLGIDWEKYSQNTRIKVLEYVSPNYEFLGFNFKKPIFQDENGKKLRRAIAYGVDRQNIIKNAYLGHGTQTDIPVHPNSWLNGEASNTYGYNLEVAKDQLNELGFVDSDGDGILENESGEKISLKLLTNTYNPIRKKVAELIRDDLTKLGVFVEIDFLDIIENPKEEDIQNQWDGLNAKLKSGDYDLVLLGWEMSLVDDVSFMVHSSQVGNGNVNGYQGEEMDLLIKEIDESGTRDLKKENYEKFGDLFVEELPQLSLFYKNRGLLVDENIMGGLNPVFFNPYNGMEKAYLKGNEN